MAKARIVIEVDTPQYSEKDLKGLLKQWQEEQEEDVYITQDANEDLKDMTWKIQWDITK